MQWPMCKNLCAQYDICQNLSKLSFSVNLLAHFPTRYWFHKIDLVMSSLKKKNVERSRNLSPKIWANYNRSCNNGIQQAISKNIHGGLNLFAGFATHPRPQKQAVAESTVKHDSRQQFLIIIMFCLLKTDYCISTTRPLFASLVGEYVISFVARSTWPRCDRISVLRKAQGEEGSLRSLITMELIKPEGLWWNGGGGEEGMRGIQQDGKRSDGTLVSV